MHAYDDVSTDKLILRDKLAIDRTLLAAERTMLAYFRTGLTLGIAGVTISKFFPENYYQILAWVFMTSGVAIMIYPLWRFRKRFFIKKEA